MLDTMLSLFRTAWVIFRIPIFLCFGIVLAIGFLCLIQFLFLYAKGYRFKKGEHYRVKRKNIFYRLFVEAPRRIALDAFARDPEFFRCVRRSERSPRPAKLSSGSAEIEQWDRPD